jgi:hypothetical protein
MRNIAESFAEGSIRLARDLPFGSERWGSSIVALATQSRAAMPSFEGAAHKRVPKHGEAMLKPQLT